MVLSPALCATREDAVSGVGKLLLKYDEKKEEYITNKNRWNKDDIYANIPKHFENVSSHQHISITKQMKQT